MCHVCMYACMYRSLRIPVKRKSAVELRAAMERLRDNDKPAYYYAMDNETPKQIASKLGVTVQDFVKVNHRSVPTVEQRVCGYRCFSGCLERTVVSRLC